MGKMGLSPMQRFDKHDSRERDDAAGGDGFS
jgi:hypothetical protein